MKANSSTLYHTSVLLKHCLTNCNKTLQCLPLSALCYVRTAAYAWQPTVCISKRSSVNPVDLIFLTNLLEMSNNSNGLWPCRSHFTCSDLSNLIYQAAVQQLIMVLLPCAIFFNLYINLLAPELFFLILAHAVYKM